MDGLSDGLGAVQRLLDDRLSAALAPHGVTLAEWSVLRALHRLGAVPPSALADACGLTRGGVTRIVDRLRAKRLVVRAAAGRADRRYQTIALTGQGAVLVPTLANAVAVVEAAALAPLTAAQRAALSAALDALRSSSRT